jgi:hypothetical protein
VQETGYVPALGNTLQVVATWIPTVMTSSARHDETALMNCYSWSQQPLASQANVTIYTAYVSNKWRHHFKERRCENVFPIQGHNTSLWSSGQSSIPGATKFSE